MSVLEQIEFEGVAPRQQYSVYPFAAATWDEVKNEMKYKVGADLFWRPTTNAQVTATLNPDFGAVETDDLIVNLTATETFFPEKRLFFLEGQEILSRRRGPSRARATSAMPAHRTRWSTRDASAANRAPDRTVEYDHQQPRSGRAGRSARRRQGHHGPIGHRYGAGRVRG
jgi:hypothetical protein